ncbi:hypothetical protein B0H12DRAFT_1122743, partial [Mycena haematopus]
MPGTLRKEYRLVVLLMSTGWCSMVDIVFSTLLDLLHAADLFAVRMRAHSSRSLVPGWIWCLLSKLWLRTLSFVCSSGLSNLSSSDRQLSLHAVPRYRSVTRPAARCRKTGGRRERSPHDTRPRLPLSFSRLKLSTLNLVYLLFTSWALDSRRSQDIKSKQAKKRMGDLVLNFLKRREAGDREGASSVLTSVVNVSFGILQYSLFERHYICLPLFGWSYFNRILLLCLHLVRPSDTKRTHSRR